MKQSEDITGKRFGRLTVLRKLARNKGERSKYECVCDCGNITTVYKYNLTNGTTKSCGCLRSEHIRKYSFEKIHGETDTRLWRIWIGMLRRCNEKQNKDYKNYGGRGIAVCDDWYDYITFKSWAINNGYSEALSLDRIDFNGMYSPDNCRWATAIEQCNNRRNNHIVSYDGENHSIAEWSRITGIPPKTLRYRIANNWDLSDAFNAPIDRKNRLARPI